MRKIRLVVEYDGRDFSGWQRQQNGPSVQAEIERAAARMVGAPVTVHGAGRTDAGVHAEGQVAVFVTASAIPALGFQRGLNALLPPAIAIVAADEAPLDFDPRRHARGKLYRYRILNAESRSPLDPRAWHVKRPLDERAMAAAAAVLVGRHDFRAFRAADCERRTTEREIRRLDVARAGALITVEVEATAFLKNMVRILVGTLVEAGLGKRGPVEVAHALRSGDRRDAGVTAPPQGLSLIRVDYDLPLPPRR